MTNEQLTKNYVEGTDDCVIPKLFLNFPSRTEKNSKTTG